MTILNMLVEITIYSTVIFAVVLLLRLIFRKQLSPMLKYALWLVLIVRLLLPVTFESSVRLPSLPETQNIAAVITQAEQTQAVETETVSDIANAAAENETLSDVSLPAQADPTESAVTKPTTGQILLIVWLSGVAIVGGCMLWAYVSLRRKMQKNVVEPSEKLTAMLGEIKAELGVRKKIRMVCQYAYGAPAMVFPRILWIPLGGMVSMSDEQARDALRHELTHVKRADPPVNMLLAALCTFYWFNPVVWVAAHLMRADMESACDATVTRRYSSAQRSEYANLLLNLYAQPALGVPALGLSGHGAKRQAKRRVTGLFHMRTSTPGAKVTAVLMTLALVVGCFTTACQPAENASGHDLDTSYPWPMDIAMETIDRVDTDAEQITPYATFAVHADVRQPEDANPSVIHVERGSMSVAQVEAILKEIEPETDWTITEPEGDLNCFSTSSTADDVTFTNVLTGIFDSSAIFQLSRDGMTVYSESDLVNSGATPKFPADELQQPISLTAKAAEKKANAARMALGATGMTLQAAERACMFETGDDGALSVASRGWELLYVPVYSCLPAIYIGGGVLYGDFQEGEVYYDEPVNPRLRIYVDEDGVQQIDWGAILTQGEVLQEQAEIVSYDEALQYVKTYMTEMFGKNTQFPWGMLKQPVEVNVTGICLCSAVVKDEPGPASDLLTADFSEGQMIPVWQVVCTIAYEGRDPIKTIELRCSALDGVPLITRW